MTDNLILILLLILLIILSVFIIVLLVKNSSNKHDLELRNDINKEFMDFQSRINHDLGAYANTTEDKLFKMEDKISNDLKESFKTNAEVFNHINERIVKIDEAQKNLDSLGNEVISLQSILQDKKNRGTFGEVELYSLLEASYGINDERYQRQFHLPNGFIADAVIMGGPSLGLLCVDSKFPLENYRKMVDLNEPSEIRDSARKQFKIDVKKHIDDIKNKYIIPGTTADMAYMFIPAEAIYSEIISSFPDLIEKSYQDKVYLVSPTTLMAYITAIKSIYLGQKKDDKAKEIQKLLAELSVEFNRFYERNEKLNKDFQSLANDFDSLKTTSEKIIKRFNKINSGEIDE